MSTTKQSARDLNPEPSDHESYTIPVAIERGTEQARIWNRNARKTQIHFELTFILNTYLDDDHQSIGYPIISK